MEQSLRTAARQSFDLALRRGLIEGPQDPATDRHQEGRLTAKAEEDLEQIEGEAVPPEVEVFPS